MSRPYRVFMKYLYGWGATVVLVGALFKLMHWPGAGVMLTLGLGTEALIFFFSAFEPLVDEVDWTIVYPELAGITDESSVANRRGGASIDPIVLENAISSALAKSGIAGSLAAAAKQPVVVQQPAVPAAASAPAAPVQAGGSAAAFVFTEKFNEMLEKAEIGPELFTKVSAGLNRLSDASSGIARIGDAVASTESFTKNMARAGHAVGKFADSYENSGQLVSRAAQVLSKSVEDTASSMEKTSKEMSSGISQIVTQMSGGLKRASDSVTSGVTEAGRQLEGLGRNLAALNAAHESQVKQISSRMSESDSLSKGVNDLMKRLAQTVQESQRYSETVTKMTSNVEKLNTIYGNMLSAMNSMSGR